MQNIFIKRYESLVSPPCNKAKATFYLAQALFILILVKGLKIINSGFPPVLRPTVLKFPLL
jgi:hypothetical protein